MKKILNGPTIYRAKCPYCDCEFEYDYSEVDSSTFADCKLVKCPGCNRYLHHKENPKITYRSEERGYYDNINNKIL